MFRAIEMRTKRDAVVGHFAEIAQAEDLKAARIGEDRVRPRHEFMQAAHLADQLMAGPEIQMIGIRKQNLNAELFEILLRLSLDRRGCANRHEDRRLDHAMRSGETPEPRARRIGGEYLEMKAHPGECIR